MLGPETEPDSLAKLRQDFENHREKTKEIEPSLIRATGTFLNDYYRWKSGERKQFPQSAALGVVFAYLRPRMVVLIGSLLIGILTAFQVWLLMRQNLLIEQQNKYINQQGHALEAQTAAILLDGLDGEREIPPSRLALLLTYGDIGLDALLTLAESKDLPIGVAAIKVITESAPKLSDYQARRATVRLLNITVDWLKTPVVSIAYERAGSFHVNRYPRPSEDAKWISLIETVPMAASQAIDAASQDSFILSEPESSVSRSMADFFNAADIDGPRARLDREELTQFQHSTALYYALFLAAWGKEERVRPLLDGELTRICDLNREPSRVSEGAPTLYDQLRDAAPPQQSVRERARLIVEERCTRPPFTELQAERN